MRTDEDIREFSRRTTCASGTGRERVAGSTAACRALVAHGDCDRGDPGRLRGEQHTGEGQCSCAAPHAALRIHDGMGDRAGGADLVGHPDAPRSPEAAAGRAARGSEGVVHGFRRRSDLLADGKHRARSDCGCAASAAPGAGAKGRARDCAADRVGSAGVGCALDHGRHC